MCFCIGKRFLRTRNRTKTYMAAKAATAVWDITAEGTWARGAMRSRSGRFETYQELERGQKRTAGLVLYLPSSSLTYELELGVHEPTYRRL